MRLAIDVVGAAPEVSCGDDYPVARQVLREDALTCGLDGVGEGPFNQARVDITTQIGKTAVAHVEQVVDCLAHSVIWINANQTAHPGDQSLNLYGRSSIAMNEPHIGGVYCSAEDYGVHVVVEEAADTTAFHCWVHVIV